MLADISSRLSGGRATDPLENQFGSNMRAKQDPSSYTLPKIAVVDPSFPINTSQAIYEAGSSPKPQLRLVSDSLGRML